MDFVQEIEETKETERLKVVTVEYEDITHGRKIPEPIIHLFCRDSSGNRREIEVEGFRPFFFISLDEFMESGYKVLNQREVLAAELPDDEYADSLGIVSDINELDHFTDNIIRVPEDRMAKSLDGDVLVKIFTKLPKHVGSIREHFDRTWEADILFPNRFLISSGIHLGAEIPAGADRVRYENWPGHSEGDKQIREITPSEAPDIRPRTLTVDIEVATEGMGFPEPHRAKQPITAITAHDNYTDEFRAWVLKSDEWDFDMENDELEDWFIDQIEGEIGRTVDWFGVYDRENVMLETFNYWVSGLDIDVVTGWNSDNFDYPYLIKRSSNLNASYLDSWTPMDNVFVAGGKDDMYTHLKGVVKFDMMPAYKKTLFRNLRSYSLEYVSTLELNESKAKLDVENLDDAWHYHPAKFMAYNVRDVEAVIDIEREKGIFNMFDNMREVTGAKYGDMTHANFHMIDMLFLRQAILEGIGLPTNTKPLRGIYHGAYVFPPIPGRHVNVVYPDLSSLYPYSMWSLNISPETFYESLDDLYEAGYRKKDAFVAYIDKRGIKEIPKGESIEGVDRDKYKGVVNEDGRPREMFEPRYDEVYFLKPSVKEGFIRKVISELVEMKYNYTGDMYDAVKRVVNSVYGTLGDSNTGGKGFRLFDWRIAEAITLVGRKIIQFTGREYERILNEHEGANASIVAGDSIPGEEPVTVRGSDGVEIVPIKELYEQDLDYDVWTEEGWTSVKNVIRKPNRKQLYTVRTNAGIVHVTEDHGLVRDSGEEVRPVDINEGESLLHHPFDEFDENDNRDINDRAWLLGFFCAGGSCGKHGWAINNTDDDLLERAGDILEEEFGYTNTVDNVMKSSGTKKLRLDGNGCGGVRSGVEEFREICYTDDQKKVPKEILNGNYTDIFSFLKGYHAGDGHIQENQYTETEKDFDEMWTKHELLGSGITYLLDRLGMDSTVSYRRANGEEYYRIRCPSFRREDETVVKSVEEYSYDGEYVYDIETENHHFHAGVGSMIIHNTDSVVTSIPGAPDYETALEWAMDASTEFESNGDEPGLYDQFVEDEFNIIFGEDEHRMEVEIESLASSCFFIASGEDVSYVLNDDGVLEKQVSENAVKKRYAQDIIWDDSGNGTWYIPPEEISSDPDFGLQFDFDPQPVDERIDVKGFEYVRSDSALITQDVQYQVLKMALMQENPDDDIYEYVNSVTNQVRSGEISAERLGKPKGINNPLEEYGMKDGKPNSTPGPTYRGAKYADTHFPWENIDGSQKPLRFYIKEVRSDTFPDYYTYEKPDGSWKYPKESLEVGDPVDAISVHDADRIPDDFQIDYDKMLEKEVKDKITPIINTVGMEWDHIVGDGRQTGLNSFM